MIDVSATAPEDLSTKSKHFKFAIELSSRYHARRQAFFESFDRVVNTLNLIFASGAVASLASGYFGKFGNGVLAALVAVLSFINLTMRSSEMATRHARLRERYGDLLKRVLKLDITDEGCGPKMKRCEEIRLDIEQDEPPANNLVVLLAHNELVLAQGDAEENLYYINRWKTFTANFWRYETNSIVSIPKYRSEQEEKERQKKEEKRHKK